MKKFWMGIVGLAATGLAGPASAADMAVKAPPPAPLPVIYNWSGFYIGANGGGGQNHKFWGFLFFVGPGVRGGWRGLSRGGIGGPIGFWLGSRPRGFWIVGPRGL